MRTKSTDSRSGFTLIELSIVLVIIGLIVGGILVGQDLVKAAEIRATITQVEKYETATNAFRIKYNYLPGDMPPAVATRLGFFAVTGGTGGTTVQNGNGRISGMEYIYFWRHLTDAQMVDGNFGTATAGNALIAGTGLLTSASVGGTVSRILPPAKLGRGNYVYVHWDSNVNRFNVIGVTNATTSAGQTQAYRITPSEGSQIDSKMDDGNASSGKVTGYGAASGCVAAGYGVGYTYNYNLNVTHAEVPGCALQINAGF